MAETLTVSSLARGALRGAAARGGCGWLAGVRGEGGRVALVSGALAAADAACDAPSAKELDALLPAGVEVVGTYRAVDAGEDGTRRQTRGRKEKWKMARRVAQAAARARCARLARVRAYAWATWVGMRSGSAVPPAAHAPGALASGGTLGLLREARLSQVPRRGVSARHRCAMSAL